MANAKLDTLDYKILKMLSIDARKPYLEVSSAKTHSQELVVN